MKTTVIATLGLMLATGIGVRSHGGLPLRPRSRIHLPGADQAPAPRRKSQPVWTGEMKVWPIEQRPDGQMLVRARIAMNPDRLPARPRRSSPR
ncbi:MAG: hypothetical protein WDO13_08810 [Verrucomicrobiota bacterium]